MNEITPNTNPVADEQNIDIKMMLFKYLSYWKWFLASFVLFMGLAAWYLMRTTPQYESRASILIKDGKSTGAGVSMLEELDLFSSTKVVENEIEILRSHTLIERVVRDLNLQVDYSAKAGLRTVSLYEGLPFRVDVEQEGSYDGPFEMTFPQSGGVAIDGVLYPANEPFAFGQGMLKVTVDEERMASWDRSRTVLVSVGDVQGMAAALRKQIDVKPSAKGTSVLILSLVGTNPRKAEDILNHLIKVYDQASVADKNNMAGITLQFIDERLQLLAADLKEEEQRVEQYKASNGITDISSESQIFLAQLQANDAQLSQTDIRLALLDDVKTYVTRPDNRTGVAPAMMGVEDPVLSGLLSSLTAAESERASALRTTKAANPIVLAMDDQIAGLKSRILDNLESQRAGLQITRAKLLKENRRFEQTIQSMPRKERELMDITRQQEIKNQQYVYLLAKREETAISYAATLPDSRLIDPAHTSNLPVRPVKKNIVTVFLLLGLIFPVVVILVRDLFDSKIGSKEDIEKRTGATVVGEIGHLEQVSKIILLAKNQSRDAEQIRTLRTNISFMLTGQGAHTVLVTSSISGEGKSLISANLGSAYAALGKRTVVLGFDLRKPGLHLIFGLNNDAGLTDYLTGQASVDKILQRVPGAENLDVITSGHTAPNPQELMHGPALAALFDELRQRYDYIIVDSAPVGLVSDAKVLDRQAEATIYVVRQRFTPKDRLRAVREIVSSRQLTNVAIVVNDIRLDEWYGYYSSYGMGKYYVKYYGEGKDKK